ncbi:TPA: restriction endonuclease subunit S [Legionella pneumophila]|nr:restriction endonuclease subunit S [Legionella pneumophila]HAU2164061.1 restriction endonuclease subunit S [Legionella pneumophila]
MTPNDWNKRKISEILEKVVLPVNVMKNEEYREIGIRSHGKGIFYKGKITGKLLGNKRVFHIEPNCLILNIVFAWEQAIAKTTQNELGMIASHRFPMYRPKNNLCNVDFILYLFNTKLGKNLLELASPGGAGRNKTLGQSEFDRLEIVLPPLSEQIKITEILSTWDKAISTAEKLLANSELQKKALMQQLLTGKKQLPNFNEKWKKIRLGNLAEINSGGTPISTVRDYYGGNISWVSISDLTSQGKWIYSTEKTLTKLGLENSSARLYPKNTVLYAMYASIGECSISGIELCTSQAILGIRPNSELNFEYLYFYLSSIKKRIKLQGQQGTQANLNAAMVKDFKIPLPTLMEQKEIVKILSIADREIEVLKQKLDYLKQEKKALMQQLLSGKRRVSI